MGRAFGREGGRLMLPDMTPHEIANEIGSRQIHSRIYGEGETFVMVEGKTDQVLWEEFRSREDCTLYPTQGKDKIIAALQVLKKREKRGVAGIIDLDYMLICASNERDMPNLLYDDCFPDSETLVLNSDALKKLLRNHLHRFEIAQVHEFAEKLREEAQRLASEFGYFRLLNYIENYGISFKNFWKRYRHGDFILIEERIKDINREDFCVKLKEICPHVSEFDLLMEVDNLRQQYPPGDIQLCQGHDLVATVAYLLPILYRWEFQEDLPENMTMAFHHSLLSASLRSAYEYRYFRETSLFNCIRSWESANSPYRILKPDI